MNALRVTVPTKDEVTGRVFDKDGRVQFSVDAMGTVTEFRYDGAGRVKQQIVYGTAVNAVAWMDSTPQAPTGSADDRVTSTLYDDLGRATTVVDAEGGITVLAYDAAGNLRQKTAYARVADAAKMQALRTAGSGWNASTLGAPLTTSLWPFASIRGLPSSIAELKISMISIRTSRKMILPWLTRDTSMRSSMRCTRWDNCLPIIWRTSSRSTCGGAARRSCKPLRIGASGLRNSCASVARNSSFRRLASFSASE